MFTVEWDEEDADFYLRGHRNDDCLYCFSQVSKIFVIGDTFGNDKLYLTDEVKKYIRK